VTTFTALFDACVLYPAPLRDLLLQLSVIVTTNLDDFPEDTLATFGIEAQHPDEFIEHLFHLSDAGGAAREVRERLQHPPMSAADYLANLERVGLSRTVAELRRFEGRL